MSEDKKPRFLQQTTSQLLHQQEALRKRREMLERESTKPPAMRFGTSTPPRNAGRHGRSPVPPSSAGERQTSHSALPPMSTVHRELNWGRSEDEKAVERAPMRFSMLFRPSPTSSVLARPQIGAAPLSPSSPCPREVNTSDQMDAMLTRLRKEASSPRTVSPRSPAPQRNRVERERTPNENETRSMESPEAVFAANAQRSAQISAEEETHAHASLTSRGNLTPSCFAAKLPASAPQTDLRETLSKEQNEATGVAAFSNIFPVPRFTPISPIAASATKRAQQIHHEEQSTPKRLGTGEFRTPQPLTRPSAARTPVVGYSSPARGEDAHLHAPSLLQETGTTPTASSTPAWLPQVLPSADVVAGVEARARSIHPIRETRTNVEPDSVTREAVYTHEDAKTAVPREAIRLSPSAVKVSPRRTKTSPAPTPQDLIHSVQVSAEKRPCGCERPTLSQESCHLRRNNTTPSRTGSPPPTPVPQSNTPMTDFGSPTRKCCDRPTPVSLSSQPAGGNMRTTTTGASSASPWPTTENIISSIMAGTSEGQRRGREADAAAVVHKTSHEPAGGTSGRFSNEEVNLSHNDSPNTAGPEMLGMHAGKEDEECIGGDGLHATLQADEAAHTPSPIPSDRHYGESLLASSEKRRCGRPTPPERLVDVAVGDDFSGRASYTASASPQPSANHLLRSLDVSIEKGSHRGKPAERATEAEGSGTSDATAAEAAGHLTAFRTPSPTPTPEHIIASLQASAEKRTRSGAVDATSGHKDSFAPAAASASCSSYQSPTLTPQNVKDSMQRLVREPQQAARCDAPAPIRPWKEMFKGTLNSASCGATWNSSASPVVTAEDVDVTLEALERDQRYQSRSSHAPRASGILPEEPSDLLRRVSVASPVKAAEPAAVEDICEIPAPATEEIALPAVVSPLPSELAVTSAMFFDCLSAPPTPALENAEVATKCDQNPISAIRGRDSAPVPRQFHDLQREVAAISEGRSRTRTTPLRACEQRSTIPARTTPGSDEDTPRAEASAEHAEVAYSATLHEAKDTKNSCRAASEKDAEAEALAHRSSLILVYPSTTPQPLLHHPHKPMPAVPIPSITPVQVPRTPTPPPRCHLQQEPFPTSERDTVNITRSAHHESPLPRPVPLRSQVSLAQPARRMLDHPRSGSPTPLSGAPCDFAAENGFGCAQPHRVGGRPPANGTAAMQDRDEMDEEANLFGPQNDWMDLVKPLRPHTITVSPQGGTVVYTEHTLRDPSRDVEGPVEPASPPLSRKRSRSVQTPQDANRQMAAATPASIALTMDDGVSSGRKSSHVAATPNTHVQQTPRSSTRGRRSQAEELLSMLPAEVVAEVVRIEEGAGAAAADSFDSRPSWGTSNGRLSGISDGNSTLGLVSTISQRVSQRPRRLYHSYDYYMQYLEGIASASAKKARKAAGRRTHRAVLKDVSSAKVIPNRQRGGGGRSSGESPMPRGSRSPSGSSRRSGSAAAHAELSAKRVREDVAVTSQTPSLPRTEGGRQLKSSTRLSAELQKTLFKEPVLAKAKRERSSRKASPNASGKSANAAKKSLASSRKGGGAAASTTTQKVAKAHPSSTRGKKPAKKFMTAKSMRLPRRSAKHGKV
ncbi:hypothetical protein GH5_03076 [Leishmania sp. Ghana 2012 LV757]|uniref:hypothetical protein n=1 Tax=Leishmania sp. Ghana 2012 LV757 TaxID=2803181 RepID=UPI001B487DDB|nr:hypothetical protein GH5_03076 [Leishmania sp. Ghana 2012 LV757]